MGYTLAEKYKFVDFWEGCMMGLPRLQPTKLCIQDGPEIMFLGLFLYILTQIITTATQIWYQMKVQNEYFWSVLILVIKCIMKHVEIKKNHIFSADIHSGGRVTKMAVICQLVVILLHLCADMIDKSLTFHLIPYLNHLKHLEQYYKVINIKAKFWPRCNLEFAF